MTRTNVCNGHCLKIAQVTPAHEKMLLELFQVINNDHAGMRNFHPHPFTENEARRIAHYAGHDLYFVASACDETVGYGMLRGWDAGFDTPSIGIYIRKEKRGAGIGKLFMSHMHAAAAERGSRAIRIKVHPHNRQAHKMYERMGYEFRDTLEPDGQLLGILQLPPYQ